MNNSSPLDKTDNDLTRRSNSILKKSSYGKSASRSRRRSESRNPIRNMPGKNEFDDTNEQRILTDKTHNNKMLDLANDLAPGVDQVIEHYEFVNGVQSEFQDRRDRYGPW